MEVEKYASRGVANTALGIGIGALALNLLNGGMAGVLGGAGCCSENTPVTRYELGMAQELSAKDGKIALLESNIYTDSKITDTYAALNGQINALAAEVRANKDAQNAVNLNQAVFNGTTTATIGCIQGQVNQLLGLSKLVIPNSSVCPGWDTAAAG